MGACRGTALVRVCQVSQPVSCSWIWYATLSDNHVMMHINRTDEAWLTIFCGDLQQCWIHIFGEFCWALVCGWQDIALVMFRNVTYHISVTCDAMNMKIDKKLISIWILFCAKFEVHQISGCNFIRCIPCSIGDFISLEVEHPLLSNIALVSFVIFSDWLQSFV